MFFSVAALSGCFDASVLKGWPCDEHDDCKGGICGDNNCCDGPCYVYWCDDLDDDGYGDPGKCIFGLSAQRERQVPNDGDCDDGDPHTHPGAAEQEDDDMCTTDADGDGWGAATGLREGVAPGRDCDDYDSTLYDCAGCNLLPQGDAEGALDAWRYSPDFGSTSCVGAVAPALFQAVSEIPCSADNPEDWPPVSPNTGDRFLAIGGVCEDLLPAATSYHVCQRVPLDRELFEGDQLNLVLRGYLQAHEFDQSGFALYPLDDEGALVSSICSEDLSNCQVKNEERAWTRRELTLTLPATVASVLVTLRGRRQVDNPHGAHAYLDDLMLYDSRCPGSSR